MSKLVGYHIDHIWLKLCYFVKFEFDLGWLVVFFFSFRLGFSILKVIIETDLKALYCYFGY